MYFQSLDSIEDGLKTRITSNPRRSLSGLFKWVRRQDKVSLIGDYVILKHILSRWNSIYPKSSWSRNQLLLAVSFTDFGKVDTKNNKIPEELEKYIKK